MLFSTQAPAKQALESLNTQCMAWNLKPRARCLTQLMRKVRMKVWWSKNLYTGLQEKLNVISQSYQLFVRAAGVALASKHRGSTHSQQVLPGGRRALSSLSTAPAAKAQTPGIGVLASSPPHPEWCKLTFPASGGCSVAKGPLPVQAHASLSWG